MNTPNICLEQARELVDYNKETGVLTWKVDSAAHPDLKKNPFGRVVYCIGAVCGRIDPNTGYRKILIQRETIIEHRFIWFWVTGEWPNVIDHINRKRDDNRWCNLRNVDTQTNNMNMTMHKHNKSGVTGVCWMKGSRKWRAQIVYKGRNKILIETEDLDKAIEFRKAAEIEYGFAKTHGLKEHYGRF